MPEHDTGDHAQKLGQPHSTNGEPCRSAVGAWLAPAPSGQPPLSNRGDETGTGEQIHCHWLSVTVHGATLSSLVKALITSLYPDASPTTYPRDWEEYGVKEASGLRFWNTAYQFPIPGLYVRGSPKDGGSYCQLELTGQACEELGIPGIHSILRGTLAIRTVSADGTETAPSLYATRIDVPFDGAPFTVQDCLGYLDRGEWLSRGRKLKVSYRRDPTGETVYGGAKSSDRLLCVYDRRGFVRCEYRAKDDYANALLTVLMLGGEQLKLGAQAQIAGWLDHIKGKAAVDAYLWLTGDSEPAPNARAATSKAMRQRAPRARLSGYVERMLPYVRLWLHMTGAKPASLLDWPLTPRAEMMARMLGLDPETKTPSSG